MELRWDWLLPVMTVPYVPALGPAHPAAVTVGLFAEVIEIAGTGRFLPHDKDRRWADRTDGQVLAGAITQEPDMTVTPCPRAIAVATWTSASNTGPGTSSRVPSALTSAGFGSGAATPRRASSATKSTTSASCRPSRRYAVRLGDRSGAFIASLSIWRVGAGSCCMWCAGVGVPGSGVHHSGRFITPGHLGIGLAAWRCGLFRLR